MIYGGTAMMSNINEPFPLISNAPINLWLGYEYIPYPENDNNLIYPCA